jgi:hypothetical protein
VSAPIPGTGRVGMLKKLLAELKKLVREARAAGWRLEVNGGGHFRLHGPPGTRPITMAATPSDRRAIDNARAVLRRALGA